METKFEAEIENIFTKCEKFATFETEINLLKEQFKLMNGKVSVTEAKLCGPFIMYVLAIDTEEGKKSVDSSANDPSVVSTLEQRSI